MSAKEDLAFGEPFVKGCVAFELPKGKSGIDTDVKADRVVGVIVSAFVGGVADAVNIVGEFVTRRDVAVHGKAAKVGGRVNGDDGVLAIDFLKDLQEVTEKRFDGIVRNLFGGTINVNTEEGVIQCTHWRVQGELVGGG